MIKLYHWKTRSYAQHEATDKLYESLNKHIDEFIEVLIGKYSKRIHQEVLRCMNFDSNWTNNGNCSFQIFFIINS